MKKLKVFIDIDQVLCDFVSGWAKIARQIAIEVPEGFGRNYCANQPTYDIAASLGISRAEEQRVWDRLKAIPKFWLGLDSMPGALDLAADLRELCRHDNVFFITARIDTIGRDVYADTKQWLWNRFGLYSWSYQVLVAREKLRIIEDLGGDVMIDDNPAILEMAIRGMSRPIKIFAPNHAYCQGIYAGGIDGVDYSGLRGLLNYCRERRPDGGQPGGAE